MIKLSSLGDIIHTLPALNVLKRAYPDAEIDWITEELGSEFLYGHPFLKNIFLFPRYSWPKKIKKGQILTIIKEIVTLREQLKRNYKLIIDFQGLFKSNFIAFLAQGEKRIGFANSRELGNLFYRNKVKVDLNLHAVLRYLMLLKFMNIPVSFKDISFPLPTAPPFPFYIKKPYIVINPIARWQSKMWFIEKWIDLSKALFKLGYEVVFSGRKTDRHYIECICQSIGGINLAGKTNLKQLIPLYKEATLVISVDTGTMHLAAATGTAVIALFGPTAPWRTGPFGKEHKVIFKALPCQPCFRRKCDSKDCMKRIEIEEIISLVKEVNYAH